KIARSGLSEHFDAIEIVADKNVTTYERLWGRHQIAPSEFVMVGNSLRSDVAPVVAAGGWGVHIPFHLSWALEEHHGPDLGDRVVTASTFDELPRAIDALIERTAE
ncbi:MAG: HAD family hydrolase, partial [Actinomycetes bacterium]